MRPEWANLGLDKMSSGAEGEGTGISSGSGDSEGAMNSEGSERGSLFSADTSRPLQWHGYAKDAVWPAPWATAKGRSPCDGRGQTGSMVGSDRLNAPAIDNSSH